MSNYGYSPQRDWVNSHRQGPGTNRAPFGGWVRSLPPVTLAILILCSVLGLVRIFSDGLTQNFGFNFILAHQEWWRFLTSMFLHASNIHLVLNMMCLVLLGEQLERALGPVRYLLAFLVAGFAGSVGCALFTQVSGYQLHSWVMSPFTVVVGASGAIFGLFGILGVFQYRAKLLDSAFMIILALNVAVGFLAPNIAWQGHLGGFLAGIVCGLLFTMRRGILGKSITPAEIVGLLCLVGALAGLAWAKYHFMF